MRHMILKLQNSV